jgi:glycogen debranching enzyme
MASRDVRPDVPVPLIGPLVHLRARPDTLYTSQNRTVIATRPDGFIDGEREKGLFVRQTRLLSRYEYRIDGVVPLPSALSNVEQHTWLGYYIVPAPGAALARDDGSGGIEGVTQQTLELRLSRFVSDGVHEDVDLTNFSLRPVTFRFTLELGADFADLDETRHGRRQQHGSITRSWGEHAGAWSLRLEYSATHRYRHQGGEGEVSLHRGVEVRLRNAGSPPHRGGVGRKEPPNQEVSHHAESIEFDVALGPGGTWHLCVDLIPLMDGEALPHVDGCRSFDGIHDVYDQRRSEFLADSTRFSTRESGTLAPVVARALERARGDLAALRLYDLDRPDGWTMAAGLPVYIALFGRDTLTTAWEAAMTGPEMMRGALHRLAGYQGTRTDDWRDEQPGRMLHEAHDGPLEVLQFNPRARYYGSITTSGFFPVVLSELWHWTGNREAVRPLVQAALDSLRWLDRYADRDGDGFYEYETRSLQGVKHQAWKDSADAVVDDTGRQVDPPIATCEEQAFVYIAKLHLSEVLWWLRERDEAKRLFREAKELRKRFNEAFWSEEDGFYVMGLDARKNQIRSAGSNAGHCLAAGIVERDKARSTADRLMAEDLFSGWGIRTLSARHPAFNPYSYHRGSVWPVEQGTFALGFMRYGLHQHVERVCRGQFEAASMFEHHRLPELFSGHPRNGAHPFPAMYPAANSPQAWSASAVFSMVQAMLGLYPYAPLRLLLVDPHLPEWLPEIRLEGLRVGKARLDLRFFRTRSGRSDYQILDMRGWIRVLRQPSPWSLTAGLGERLRDLLL